MIILKNKELNEFVGQAFEELSMESMEELQGSSDINPRTTIVCIESALASYELLTITICRP